jgi:hypothetical protein
MRFVADPSSWPAVVSGALDKVPVEHFASLLWIAVGIAVTMGLIAFIPKILRPAQSAEQTAAAVSSGIHDAINGQFKRISERLDRLERKLDENRDAADERHEQNLDRFRRYERIAGGRPNPWDGEERRQPQKWDGLTDRRKR